jgi:LmbE family N-acetylglucosaminyl deacetylase
MRILAVHAHPDDVEILAGGTMALLAERGHEIQIATMTPGDCGSRDLPPDEIAAVRRREAADAAAQIGAAYTCLEFRDLAIFNDDSSRRRVVELLRAVRPDVVLTASPEDYLCDHEITSALVRDACFGAPMPNYRTGGAAPVLDRIPHLYWMDPLMSRDRSSSVVAPEFVVNVGSTFTRKVAMLSAHRSQRDWLKSHHGTDDYLLEMERWTRERGQMAGVTYGEGFRQYRGHAYPVSPLLQEAVA